MVTRFTSDDARLADNQPLFFGDDQDASIQFTGTVLAIAGDLVIGGPSDKIGFFDTNPIVQPTVTLFNNFATLGDVVSGLQALGLFETP
jgi:hypothetical protein